MNDITITPISKTELLESKMLEMPQVECDTIHHIQDNFYIREVHIPAGTFAVGHYQKYPHINIFVKGKVMMINPETGEYGLLEAPLTFIGAPGRKIGYVIEDVVWQNVYNVEFTEERDVKVLEHFFIDKSETFLQYQAHRFALESLKHEQDKQDYKNLLLELNLTEEEVQKQVNNTDDICDLPAGEYKFITDISAIDGIGVFATSKIKQYEVIGPSRLNGKRTLLGRYVNHSITPNAEMQVVGDDVYLVAIRDIQGQQGGLNGEEITIDYRQTIKLLRGQ